MPVANAIDKTQIIRDREREQRKEKRAELMALRGHLKVAKAHLKTVIEHARQECRKLRLDLRERLKAKRARVLAKLRESARRAREAARVTCAAKMEKAKDKTLVERRREEYKAMAEYQADMRRIARTEVKGTAKHHRSTAAERRQESEDHVRSNLPPEMHALFERVKGGIKATDRMSRSEAMALYAEEHPKELLASIQHEADVRVRDFEREVARREREEARPLKGVRKTRPKYTQEELAAVPF